MALLYAAEIRPTKLELLTPWLPGRPWYVGPAIPELTRVAAYRFDDPAGEVGIETLLVRAGDGPVFQVPLTYRGAPLDGAQRWLVGTMQHSVLGRRWAYDACGDPVYAAVLAEVIRTGASQAEELVEVDGRPEPRDSGVRVRGSGTGAAGAATVDDIARVDDADPTIVRAGRVELSVHRVVGAAEPASADSDDRLTLTGTWTGQPTPVVLARGRWFRA